jgi:hypothetical protein
VLGKYPRATTAFGLRSVFRRRVRERGRVWVRGRLPSMCPPSRDWCYACRLSALCLCLRPRVPPDDVRPGMCGPSRFGPARLPVSRSVVGREVRRGRGETPRSVERSCGPPNTLHVQAISSRDVLGKA